MPPRARLPATSRALKCPMASSGRRRASGNARRLPWPGASAVPAGAFELDASLVVEVPVVGAVEPPLGSAAFYRRARSGLLGHGSDLPFVAVRTAIMAMVVSTGLRRAVLVVPIVVIAMVVIAVGVVDPRDRARRRGDDRRWSRRDGCRGDGCRGDGRRGNGRRGDGCSDGGRRGDGRGRRRRRARGRWRWVGGPGSADGRCRSGRCAAARNRAKCRHASYGRAGGDPHGRRRDLRRRDDGRLHGARGARRRRRAGGGPDRRLGAPLQNAREAEREGGDQRRRGDSDGLGVTLPPGLPDPVARGRGRRGSILRVSRLARRRGLARSS